ncbi:hypothetical protein SAMD00023353_1002920 [Rosellinia necatrix]|uniref:Uncharacterized protein n=1 Tax=Rosellinia necatrix TaxID=77044 RepID=A0A1S8A6R0_ROSNE|nr:hypothetical protein SAMD00023353_1002920 [Rosellinia necatrix]
MLEKMVSDLAEVKANTSQVPPSQGVHVSLDRDPFDQESTPEIRRESSQVGPSSSRLGIKRRKSDTSLSEIDTNEDDMTEDMKE